MLDLYIDILALSVPFFFFLFYGHEIFGLPRYLVLVYLAGLAIGFTLWKPMLLITLSLSWIIVVSSYVRMLWGIFFYKGDLD